jgi:hypothetical protein
MNDRSLPYVVRKHPPSSRLRLRALENVVSSRHFTAAERAAAQAELDQLNAGGR